MSDTRQPRPQVGINQLGPGRQIRDDAHPFNYAHDMYYDMEYEEYERKKNFKIFAAVAAGFFLMVIFLFSNNTNSPRPPQNIHTPRHRLSLDRPTFMPPTYSTLNVGESVKITSQWAKGICYSMSNKPECFPDGHGCNSGFYIEGSSGYTLPITSSMSFKAVGCLEEEETIMKPSIVQATYTITNKLESVEFYPPNGATLYPGMSISLKSNRAKGLCYTLGDHDPVCEEDGKGCTIGTYISGDSGTTSSVKIGTKVRAMGCADKTTRPSSGKHTSIKRANYFMAHIEHPSDHTRPHPGEAPYTSNIINVEEWGQPHHEQRHEQHHQHAGVFHFHDKNCSEGTFKCPPGYVCDKSAAILGNAHGCVKPQEVVGTVIKNSIYQEEKEDLLEIGPNVSINIFNEQYAKLDNMKISIAIVGKGFYFAVDIPVTGMNNVTGLTKLGQFYVDSKGFVRDMMGFALKPSVKLADNENCISCKARQYILEIDRNGQMFFYEKGMDEKYKLDLRIKIAYIQNEVGLDFYNSYPFYIDCKEVVCTRPELDEMPIWYYTPTDKSGEPLYIYPFDDHAGYLRPSLAVGAQALYFAGTTPYDIH